MTSPVLYQIPFAAWPVRLLIGVASSVFVLAIYGSWLPRAIRMLRQLSGSQAQRTLRLAIAVIPVLIGIGPLLILIAVIRNPTTTVSDAGVSKERMFSQTPVSLAWSEIAQVNCRLGRYGRVSTIALTSDDGRTIGFGNPGGVDFESVRHVLTQRLGAVVTPRCAK